MDHNMRGQKQEQPICRTIKYLYCFECKKFRVLWSEQTIALHCKKYHKITLSEYAKRNAQEVKFITQVLAQIDGVAPIKDYEKVIDPLWCEDENCLNLLLNLRGNKPDKKRG